MNKKILVIPVLLLTFALFSLPVMCAPATKIWVTVTQVATQDILTSRSSSHDTIWHNTGTSDGTVTLIIPGQDPLSGTRYGEWSSRLKWSNYPDPDPEAELLINAKVVWTFTGGTFEGVGQRKITGYPISGSSYFEDHSVFQGTGIFKGWTLKLSYEGTPPVIPEAYLIMPK